MLNVFFLAQIATANASLGSAEGISSSNSPLRSGVYTLQLGEDGKMKLVHHDVVQGDGLKPKIVKQHLGKASKTYLGALKKHMWGRIALWSVAVTFPIFLLTFIINAATAGYIAPIAVTILPITLLISELAGFILTIFQLIYGTTPFRVIAVLHILTSLALGGFMYYGVTSTSVTSTSGNVTTMVTSPTWTFLLVLVGGVVLHLFYFIVRVCIPFVRLQGWSKVSFFYD